MPIELKGANAVVLARLPFRPEVFSLAWTVRHLGIPAEDFPEHGVIQSPILFNMPTRRFNLVVIPERIQLNLNPSAQREEDEEAEGDLVRRIMREVIAHVPQLSSPGAGLNFNWTLISEERPNRKTSRRLFCAEDKPFFREFADESACFGTYASKEYHGTRLRVEARPIHDPNDEPNGRQIIFNFNFNVDLVGNDQIGHIERLLGHWEKTKEESSRIMDIVSRECGV
jgi:hypothetical protein